jgi:V/A-type H+-transporting ATPase subunit I
VVIAAGLTIWLGDVALGDPALWAIGGGLLTIFLGAAIGRPTPGARSMTSRFLDGLVSLTGVTKLFGDLLSYLRLFALGLASASLAATFNTLAFDIKAAHPGLGVLFAALVLLFGHSINILIGVMSGVVHGLRLNYIEFFGWGLTEEGYPFRAFAKRESPA